MPDDSQTTLELTETDSEASLSESSQVTREAVRTLSMAGMSDVQILERFPDLKGATLRKWRERDTVWAAVFSTLRNTRAITQSKAVEVSHIVTKAAGTTLSELHSSTALKLATAAAVSLGTFADKPPVPKDWAEAATAYKVQRLACGVDREDGGKVSVNLAMFTGQPAANVSQIGESPPEMMWESVVEPGESEET